MTYLMNILMWKVGRRMNIKFIKRNSKIYIQDKMGIFFSFLGVLISLVIYCFFLRKNIVQSISQYPNAARITDLWMMGGLISISATTTTLSTFSQKLNDYCTHKIYDFTVNESFSTTKLDFLYVVTAIIQGFISVTIFTIIIFIYLENKYNNIVNISTFIDIELSSLTLIIFSALFFNLITNYIKSVNSFASLSAIVGTLAGFLSGSYIPYGSLPKIIQKIMSCWLGYQNAAYIRFLLNKHLNIPTFIKNRLFENLGVATSINSFALCFLISFIIILFLNIFSKKKIKY